MERDWQLTSTLECLDNLLRVGTVLVFVLVRTEQAVGMVFFVVPFVVLMLHAAVCGQ
jgi:hypothetical protein